MKDLGVYFDSKMTFNVHIEKTVQSAYATLGFIIRNSDSFQQISTLNSLYFAYVRSKMEYCSVVWAPYYQVYRDMIEKVQRRFLKYIYYRTHGVYPERGYDHSLLLDEFYFSSLEKRRTIACLVFMYKLVNEHISCPSLKNQIDFYSHRDSSRLQRTFACPRANTNLMLKSPIYYMTSTFNRILGRTDVLNCSLNEFVAEVSSNYRE